MGQGMAFQFYNPAPVLEGLLGISNAAGGRLFFYERGTTTPLDTYNSPEATTPNANPVQLDSAARANTPIFLDGEYTVVLKDSGGATIWSRDVVSGAGAGTTIPALVTGQFLTNDGTNLLWAQVLQMPDPTGSTNQYPVTDGSGYVLQNVPEPIEPEVIVDDNSFQAGTSASTTKFLPQWGTASATASGGVTTTDDIVFEKPFTAPPVVFICVKSGSVTAGGYLTDTGANNVTATGFTSVFNSDHGNDSAAASAILSDIPYMWIAFGNVVVEAP